MEKLITFEDFLNDKHTQEYIGSDDDMPDAFDAWIGDMDTSEVMEYAEEYGRKVYLQGFDSGKKVIK